MKALDHQEFSGASTPGLLILTGASHTGKTSVAKALLETLEPPAAFLSVDDVLRYTISRPPGYPWALIPLAYELLEPQIAVLLKHRWFVVLESTFTYVPRGQVGQFHREQLLRMLDVSRRHGVPALVVQLLAGDAISRDRARLTGRLPQAVVEETARLHRAADLPTESLQIKADMSSPGELARQVLSSFTTLSAG